jgi:conjugal transfer pilus assembly protein TrbC
LLRTLKSLFTLCLSATFVLAQEAPAPNFAPGSLGTLDVDVDELMARARRDAAQLGEGLQSQAPANLEALSPALEDLQARAMNDPRVRELLGLGSDGAAVSDAKPDYREARVIVFASFAMPAPSLRKVMEDAERLQGQVVMRGFVENSVFKTEAALARVFGDLAEAKSFAIDPTLFRRFDVSAVPVYVVLNGKLDSCKTPNCSEDPPPPHDRVSGNIELQAALELVARAGGEASATAEALLATVETPKATEGAP